MEPTTLTTASARNCLSWVTQGSCSHGCRCRFLHRRSMKGSAQVLRINNIHSQLALLLHSATRVIETEQLRMRHSSPEESAGSESVADQLRPEEPLIFISGPKSAVAEQESCGICLEIPSKYGILDKCDHAFCFGCIMKWRKTSLGGVVSWTPSGEINLSCPLCRTESRVAIPSSVSPAELRSYNRPEHRNDSQNPTKHKAIGDYLRAFRSIPCPYFAESVEQWADIGLPQTSALLVREQLPSIPPSSCRAWGPVYLLGLGAPASA